MTFEDTSMMRFLFLFCFCITFCYCTQAQRNVDFTKVEAQIKPYSNGLSGVARYDFTVLKSVDTLRLDAVNMEFSSVYLSNKAVTDNLHYDGKQVKLAVKLAPGSYKLKLGYVTQPKQTVYFIPRDTTASIRQIWTQGQGKYTSHWLPSFDAMDEKLEFDLHFYVPSKYTVIANGKLIDTTSTGGLTHWEFDMKNPMSSYLAAFVIGDFDKRTIQSTSGIPIALYYEPKDSLNYEPTYRYTKEIFNFLEEEIGVAYPWQTYKQVPVQDFLYAGMENTSCTIFSNQYVIDSTAFVDKNYVNVNAHELAHQWFGNLVTEASGDHHWLHEGFATYYAYLTERALFGDDHFYWKLYQTARTLQNLSENEGGEALTDPNANSLTFYEKGAWALVALRNRVGDAAFKKGIQTYLKTHAFNNARIDDFLGHLETTSGTDLGNFKEVWLSNEEFPWEEVRTLLAKQNKSVGLFMELLEKEVTQDSVMAYWDKGYPVPYKRAFLSKFGPQLSEVTLSQLLEGEGVEVRQSGAMVWPSLTEEYRPFLETFFADDSYVTKELILFKLWQAFPERRTNYLEMLDGVTGLPNKNVRQLWLALSLLTDGYSLENKRAWYAELNGYAQPQYSFEVRQLALQYLVQLGALDDQSLLSLFKATSHHVWQFKKYARNTLREFQKSEQGEQQLTQLRTLLTPVEQEQLSRILNP